MEIQRIFNISTEHYDFKTLELKKILILIYYTIASSNIVAL